MCHVWGTISLPCWAPWRAGRTGMKKLNSTMANSTGSGGAGIPSTSTKSTEEYSPFLVIHSEDGILKKMSPFFICKGIKGICEDPKNIKKLPSGDYLIETKTQTQSKILLETSKIGNIAVNITKHRTLNHSQGVISEIDLLHVPESELTTELSSQGVVAAKRIKIKRNNELINTKHVILTFNSPKLPSYINAGYLRCATRIYIPNPLRCFKCQRFGHSKNVCRGKDACSKCGNQDANHNSETCNAAEQCVNCNGNHASFSKTCPKWLQEKQIQEIKAKENISYPEARSKVLSNQQTTYATIVQGKSVSRKTTACQTEISIHPTYVSTATNTVFSPNIATQTTISGTSIPTNKTNAKKHIPKKEDKTVKDRISKIEDSLKKKKDRKVISSEKQKSNSKKIKTLEYLRNKHKIPNNADESSYEDENSSEMEYDTQNSCSIFKNVAGTSSLKNNQDKLTKSERDKRPPTQQ